MDSDLHKSNQSKKSENITETNLTNTHKYLNRFSTHYIYFQVVTDTARHWYKCGHPGSPSVISAAEKKPTLTTASLKKPTSDPREDLLTMHGPWECEECGDKVPDRADILSHVRRVHAECHVSNLLVRHSRSRRVYPFTMIYRHTVSCGVDGCNMFSSRNCVLENCLLDLRRHWQEDHHNLN